VRTLCIGDALVDLVCERRVDGLAEADAFARHLGGATANACVVAARLGAGVALAGGAGDDEWGRWLRDRLAAEGVGMDWFGLVADEPTGLAFVTVDRAGEPSFHLRSGATGSLERVEEALAAHDALAFSSNALVGEAERAATLAAREEALAAGKPVVVDANLRLHRWPHPGRAATETRACLPEAFLVKCNRAEAQMLSGEADPLRAAEGLLAGGARNVIVTLGAEGALLRGELRHRVAGAPAEVVNTSGAGDAFLGVLLARLGQSDYYPPTLAAALAEAAREGARATERWSAV
jgi:fructokinase